MNSATRRKHVKYHPLKPMTSYLVLVPFLIALGCQAGVRTEPGNDTTFDEKLLGSWQVVFDDGKPDWNAAPIVISKLGGREYIAGPVALGDIALNLRDASKIQIVSAERYRFLYIQPLEDSKAWNVARLEMSGNDVLQLHFVKENVFPKKELNPSELAAILKRHAEDPATYARYGTLNLRRISEDQSIPAASVDMFNVEFGILFPRTFGVKEHTTTIPFDLCDSFRFGFYIRPPDGRSYEVRTVHHLPAIPLAVDGDSASFETTHALTLKSGTRTARGPKRVAYGFGAGDPLGAYKMELYINSALHTEVSYSVVQPESVRECESVADWVLEPNIE